MNNALGNHSTCFKFQQETWFPASSSGHFFSLYAFNALLFEEQAKFEGTSKLTREIQISCPCATNVVKIAICTMRFNEGT
jgi:hypothetical protein